MNTLDLPVSFGEALDKLSILEIKLKNIKDERRQDVETEYTLLYSKLKDKFTDNSQYHYDILKDINSRIWYMQDIFRESINEEEKNKLCMQIIEENDRRFRVKSKLNILFNSLLREQKGYIKKKAFVLSHLGLGDNLTFSGAVRFLSTMYDEVKVVCKEKYYSNLQLMYSDDPSITFHIIKNDEDISPRFGCPYQSFLSTVKGYHIYLCGLHMFDKQCASFDTIPFCFYKDVNMDYNTFWTYFHIPTISESTSLYNLLLDSSYAVLHTGSSTGECISIEAVETKFNISRNDIILIDVNRNIYPETHKFHKIADLFVNKPLAYYKDSLINATYVIVSDSSVFCMAMNLSIKTDNCYVVSRSSGYSYIYSEQFGYSPTLNKPRFKKLIL
jgi:hypothetical protein